MSLSIIIPTYDSVDYLIELIESIKIEKEIEFEVLIGIDNCSKTLDFVRSNQFNDIFKFYFFDQNYGPYVIKNTLSELSKFDKLLFFDSDDIMLDGLIKVVSDKLNNFECVKPKYIDFNEVDSERIYSDKKNTFGEGVFGIQKNLFLTMNGFEGWRVAADSDFMGRLYSTNRKVYLTPQPLFYRRIHPNSLTVRPDTGYSSQLRGKYSKISKNKKNKPVNDEFVKGSYRMLDLSTNEFLNPVIAKEKNDEVIQDAEIKKRKQDLLQSIFSNTPKEVVIKTEVKQINYKKVNQRTNQIANSNLASALKKANSENVKKFLGRR